MKNPTEVIAGELYKHYKNKQVYRIIGVAKHTETLEDMVIYAPYSYKNEKSDLWARPLSMFLETVELDGNKVPRFSKEGVSEL